MQNDVKVSVVIPTYNRCIDLERALRSVLMQTMNSFEVIVVDNHSEDGTDVMINNLNVDNIRVFKIYNHGIIATSRNKGIQEARGKYIAFLDSDDWWTPEKLQKSVEALEKGEDLVYHELRVVRSEKLKALGRPIGVQPLKKPIFDDLLEKGGAIATSSVVVRAELLKAVNGFSEDASLVIVEDFDCWLRLAKITDRFFCLPGSYGYYLNGELNQSRNAERILTANNRLYELYLSSAKRGDALMPIWYLYSIGRAYYVLGNWKSSRNFLKQILFRKTSWMIKFKVVGMLIIKQNTLH